MATAIIHEANNMEEVWLASQIDHVFEKVDIRYVLKQSTIIVRLQWPVVVPQWLVRMCQVFQLQKLAQLTSDQVNLQLETNQPSTVNKMYLSSRNPDRLFKHQPGVDFRTRWGGQGSPVLVENPVDRRPDKALELKRPFDPRFRLRLADQGQCVNYGLQEVVVITLQLFNHI